MTLIAVIDTETHSTDEDARVIELAALHLLLPHYGNPSGVDSWLFAPGGDRRVTAQASAVHHLTNANLVDCSSSFNISAWVKAVGAADYVAAHNAAFDRAVVERSICAPSDKLWLCTLKLSRVAWPEAPAYGLQVLRYHLGLSGVAGEVLGDHPHRAAYDATVCAWLLRRLLIHFECDLTKMLNISESPSLLRTVGFGKHRGTRWGELPKDYLRWVVNQDFGEDELYTARYYLW